MEAAPGAVEGRVVSPGLGQALGPEVAVPEPVKATAHHCPEEAQKARVPVLVRLEVPRQRGPTSSFPETAAARGQRLRRQIGCPAIVVYVPN